MKLLPEEFDLLIAEYRNQAAHAESTNDWDYADFCKKRLAQFLKAREGERAVKAQPKLRQPRPDAPKPPKLN